MRRTNPWILSCLCALGAAACGAGDMSGGEEVGAAVSDITINTSATYNLVGVQSGKCVDVLGASTASLAKLDIASCNGSTHQQFRAEAVGSGFRLRNVNSNLCVDVSGASTADGAAVIQYACGTGTNQQWSFSDVAGGAERLTVTHSGKALDVTGKSTADGALLEQWASNNGTNQQFRMQLVGTGGAGGGGGSSGSGGAGGGATGGSTGASGCSLVPINPNATAQARKLLCYLQSQSGNHVLSGQQETSWAQNPDVDVSYINAHTGKFPVVRGGDFLYPNGTTTRAQAWWNAGGVPMLCYHMGAPPLSDSYANSQVAAGGGINAVLTPGTASYASFTQKLDYAAGELQKLQAANVAVLWRPFHEAGGTWFWWSKEGGAQYVRLWTFAYNYLTNTKGLKNLIWLHPYDGSPSSAFYPGKSFVDVGGADTYASNPPFTALYNSTRGIVGSSIPIALHENGLMPDPGTMFGSGTKTPWVLFNTWADTYLTVTNSVSYLQSVYASPFTVTRDEVPSLK